MEKLENNSKAVYVIGMGREKREGNQHLQGVCYIWDPRYHIYYLTSSMKQHYKNQVLLSLSYVWGK